MMDITTLMGVCERVKAKRWDEIYALASGLRADTLAELSGQSDAEFDAGISLAGKSIGSDVETLICVLFGVATGTERE